MDFHMDIWGAIEGTAEELYPLILRKVNEIRTVFNRMKVTYETQRQIELDHAATLRQLCLEVGDLRDEICLATQNSHVGTSQCSDALLAAIENLTKAIDELESLDAVDKLFT